MKKIFTILLGFITSSAMAQSAEEVIQKYSANMGGLDAFNKLTSAKMTGAYSTQGQDFPLTSLILNGKGMRMDIDILNQAVTNCYFNGSGWKINPFAGVPSATEVSGAELNDFKTQCYLSNSLMDYKARGHQVEMSGKETVEGIETYKLKLTSKEDGRVTHFYISTADYTLIKSSTEKEIQGQAMEVETFYSNLKEFGGVKFFMTRDSKIEGQVFQTVKFDKVELNVPVEEKIFAMPH
jgi:hypothetical protein